MDKRFIEVIGCAGMSFGTDSNVNDALSAIGHIHVRHALAAQCPRCTVGPHLPSHKSLPTISVQRWQQIGKDARTARLPNIIQDAFSEPAKTWSPKSFCNRWPDKQVHVTVNLPRHGVPYLERSDIYQKTITMTEFVNLLDNGTVCYLNQVSIGSFAELKRELDLSHLRLSRLYSVNLWLGGKTKSGLHFDSADNLFGQIYGRKRVLLIGPQFSKYLYPFDDNPSKSSVDPESLDLGQYPLFSRCEVWECTLDPGYGLYIPRGWWHYIAAEDISISVNCWHGQTLSNLERINQFLAGGPRVALRAIRDFVWYGMLAHPYQQRLFSPAPLGVQIYRRIRSIIAKK